MIKNFKRGFTLIELLVVMSVIGLLAAISIFATQGARESARDGKRKADLEQIRSVLELYRADCGSYPAPVGNVVPSPLTGPGTCSPAGNTYANPVPQDTSPRRYYYTRPTTTTYFVCANLEKPPNPTPAPIGACGNNCGGPCHYSVRNP